jgi:hypothetical protein
MTDYISRDDVLKAIDYQHEVNHVFESEAAYVHMWETINDDIGIKSADVQPVKHGRWEDCEIRGSLAMRCSVCGNDSGVLYNYAYCPSCGARMDGEWNDD